MLYELDAEDLKYVSRAYNADDVDEYIDELKTEIETLEGEKEELEDRLAELNGGLKTACETILREIGYDDTGYILQLKDDILNILENKYHFSISNLK